MKQETNLSEFYEFPPDINKSLDIKYHIDISPSRDKYKDTSVELNHKPTEESIKREFAQLIKGFPNSDFAAIEIPGMNSYMEVDIRDGNVTLYCGIDVDLNINE